MALSYIGINYTPKEHMEDYNGYTQFAGLKGSTHKSLSASGITSAMENYINGNGKYSPPVIHIPGYSSAGHYVVVVGKISGNTYQILDPWDCAVTSMTINGTSATYNKGGSTVYDKIDQLHQWYNPNAKLPDSSEHSCDDPYCDTCRIKLSISGASTPGTLVTGHGMTVNGVISSGSSLSNVTAGAYDCNGLMKTGISVNPNSKTFDLNTRDADIRFSSLSPGVYTYRVTATNELTSKTLVEKVFIVLSESRTVEDGTYYILANTTDYAVSVAGTESGDNVELATTDEAKETQQFVITYEGDGYYSVVNKASGDAVGVDGGASSDDGNIIQWYDFGSEAQRWQILPVGNTYCFVPQCTTTHCLDVYDGDMEDGANLWIYYANLTAAQRFYLDKFDSDIEVSFEPNQGTIPYAWRICSVDGVNTGRGENKMIVYTQSGQTVDTNIYGHELAISAEGEVLAYREYGEEEQLTVPEGGFVISAHGTSGTSDAAYFICQVDIGDYIGYDAKVDVLYHYTSRDAYLFHHKTVTKGSTYGTLPVLTREGYTFDGWYTSPTGGTEVTADTVVTADSAHTLYAHWKENKIQVYYEVPYGDIPEPANSHPIDGFNTGRGTGELIVYNRSGETTNTNKWGREYAFDSQGRFVAERGWGVEEQLTVPEGGFILSAQVDGADGSDAGNFLIWTSQDFYWAYDEVYAYAYETLNDYLFYHKTVSTGSSYGQLPVPTSFEEGYTFDGWYTEPEGGTKVTEDTIVTADSSHTLYAHWTKETYTITYKGNIYGGGSNVPASQTKEQGNGIFLSEQIPSGELRADFIFNDGERGVHQSVPATFKEWNTKADGTGECYMPGDTYVADESVTLYAQWEATVDLLEDPVWEGHRFDGWFYEPMYGEGTRLNGPLKITQNTEIFAHWTEVEEPPAPVEPDENTAVFRVSSVQGRPGQTVEVTVSLENNPGLIAASMALAYDETKLTLVEAVDTELLADGVFSKLLDTNPFHMRWEDSLADGDNTATGTIATLKFKIAEDCPEGEIPLTLTLSSTEIYNYDVEIVASAGENGSIQVVQYVPGDGNGDGTADSRDVTILRRYLAHWPNITIDLPAMDVNADGASDSRDVTVMRRYLAHWPGYTLGGQPLSAAYSVQGEEVPKGTDPLKLTVSDVSGLPGEEVEVTITMENNPGVVAACLDLAYDESKLELVKVADGGILNDPTFSKTTETNPYALRWEDSLAEENNGKNGVIATLTFRILETCEPGTIPLTLTFRPGEIYDVDLNPVPAQAVNGAVTVETDFWAGFGDSDLDFTVVVGGSSGSSGWGTKATMFVAAYEDSGQMIGCYSEEVTFTQNKTDMSIDKPFGDVEYRVFFLDEDMVPLCEGLVIEP